MDLQAGFAEVDITPQVFPATTYWSTVDAVVDPLFAHAGVFHDGATVDDLSSYNVFKGLVERGWYRWSLDRLKTYHSRSDHETAEIQVVRIGDTVFGAAPAEYFCQHSLRIKEQSPAKQTFVVSLANGWLGYIPHREAFERIGGHESTWCISSKMEPEAGDRMADAVLHLISRVSA